MILIIIMEMMKKVLVVYIRVNLKMIKFVEQADLNLVIKRSIMENGKIMK